MMSKKIDFFISWPFIFNNNYLNMNKNKKILLLGDSITQYSNDLKNNGWAIHLHEYFSGKADILNRSREAHTTKSILPFVKEYFNKQNQDQYVGDVDMIIMTLGSNDASDPSKFVDKKWNQYTSLEEYEYYVNELLNIFVNNNVKYILLVTPPQMNTDNWNKYSTKYFKLPSDVKSYELMKSYADKLIELKNKRTEKNIMLINLWENKWGHTCFVDGLHLSKEGNKFFFNSLKNTIDSIDDMNPKKLKYNIPDFDFN